MGSGPGRDLRTARAAVDDGGGGRAPSATALKDASLVVEGGCQDSVSEDPGRRVARHGNQVVIEVGGDAGRVIVVDPTGWNVVDESPVLFRRTQLTGVLPTPVRGLTVDSLHPLLNIHSESWPLYVAALVASFIPGIPHPLLIFQGEQGTGKSSAARITVGLVDPSPAPLRTAPSDENGFALIASSAWAIALDNVSSIRPWLSDALCRAVTGDASVRRRLYADQALVVFRYQRVVILTSIDPGALRGDLAERVLPIELEPISPGARLADEELNRRFEELKPGVLGAILDLLVESVRNLPDVQLTELPRMADFARILAALPEQLGADLVDRYVDTGRRVAADVLDGDPLAQAVVQFVEQSGDGWEGTNEQLRQILMPEDRIPRAYPKTARAMSQALRRAAPILRGAGVMVHFPPKKDKRRILRLERRDSLQPPTQPRLPEEGDHERAREQGERDVVGDMGDEGGSSGDPPGSETEFREVVDLLQREFDATVLPSSAADYIQLRSGEGAMARAITSELTALRYPPPTGASEWTRAAVVHLRGGSEV